MLAGNGQLQFVKNLMLSGDLAMAMVPAGRVPLCPIRSETVGARSIVAAGARGPRCTQFLRKPRAMKAPKKERYPSH